MEIRRFPNKLKFFRDCHGYSQKKVSRLLSIADPSTLSRWEQGMVIPSLYQVFRLCHIYKTLPHELYEGCWKESKEKVHLSAEG